MRLSAFLGSNGRSGAQSPPPVSRPRAAAPGLCRGAGGCYTVALAPAGSAEGEMSLWVRQEHGFPGHRPGEHTVAERVWQRLMDDERLLQKLDPRLVSEGKGDQWRLWPAEDEQINVETLWDYFCRFTYLPMLTAPGALAQTIAWGVQRGLFAYALGDGESFDTTSTFVL